MRATATLSARQKKWVDLMRQQEQAVRRQKLFAGTAASVSNRSIAGGNGCRQASQCGSRWSVFRATGTSQDAPVELILASGDRLRIAPGAEAATLANRAEACCGNMHDASAGGESTVGPAC